MLGANVIGYSIDEGAPQGSFLLSGIQHHITHYIGDIRDAQKVRAVFDQFRPDAVIHMAAQAIVRNAYTDPVYTYDTNVLGTLNVLEAMRKCGSCCAGLIITSDKCYDNNEWIYGYREIDRLGGKDIYSSSKACAELLTRSYRDSFLDLSEYKKHGKLLITARAGNVVGGGDWADCRIIPDCIRALMKNETIRVRNPDSVRPWQHVLEPLYGYLLLLKSALNGDTTCSGAWNFGPEPESVITVKQLVEKLIGTWGSGAYSCDIEPSDPIKECGLLNLDTCKARYHLGWQPAWGINTTIRETVEWYRKFRDTDVLSLCQNQINEYCSAVEASSALFEPLPEY
jgi:CDP-glucose 4,6-dehydratase